MAKMEKIALEMVFSNVYDLILHAPQYAGDGRIDSY